MVNPDGSGLQRIALSPKDQVYDQPDWSPDGNQIAFGIFPANGPASVAVVRGDGTGMRQVTPACTKKPAPNAVPAGCEDAANVSFTPDGQHLTYTRATGHVRNFPKYQWDQIEHAAVAIIGTDGTGERTLLQLPRYAGDFNYPQMSPNGKWIVFERVNSPLSKPKLGRALFVMNTDGSNVRRITPWKLSGGDNPDWAPDSSRILFRSNEDVNDVRSQYYTVRPDGTGLTRLTNFRFSPNRRLFSATFSPDGKQIVFGRADSNGRGDLWVMNADGSNPHPVFSAKPWDSAPDWGSG